MAARAMTQTSVVCFEQPLSERIRTLLRLEALFEYAQHHAADESEWGRRAAMAGLLDILVLLSRSDLRTELLKELAERHHHLARLQNRPGVDQTRLNLVLEELEQFGEGLNRISPHAAGVMLKDSDFLTSILNRTSIPGGTCGFDVPGYHRWLKLSPEIQKRDMDRWYRDLRPYQEAVGLVTRLLRESAVPATKRADGGVYVHTLESPCQMIRVLLPGGSPFYPEISAGKHRCTIRFMEHADVNGRPSQTTQSVPFQLMLCSL
jgi:cell division protein ZapD